MECTFVTLNQVCNLPIVITIPVLKKTDNFYMNTLYKV